MKKLIAIILVVFFTASLAEAQMVQQNKGEQQPMMCKMHHKMKMKQKPMQPMMMKVKLLPMMGEELELTDDQMNKIMDLKANQMMKMAEIKVRQMKESMKMKKLIKDMASVEMVRNQMNKCSEIMVDIKLSHYQTAKEMMEVLTEEQKEKFKSMMDECMMSNCQQGMMNMDQDDQ